MSLGGREYKKKGRRVKIKKKEMFFREGGRELGGV